MAPGGTRPHRTPLLTAARSLRLRAAAPPGAGRTGLSPSAAMELPSFASLYSAPSSFPATAALDGVEPGAASWHASALVSTPSWRVRPCAGAPALCAAAWLARGKREAVLYGGAARARPLRGFSRARVLGLQEPAAVSQAGASGAGPVAAVLPSTTENWLGDDGRPVRPADRSAPAQPGGEAAASGEAPRPARGRRGAVHSHCRVLGCHQPLQLLPAVPAERGGRKLEAYSKSSGVCMAHLRSDTVELDGVRLRYCQARKGTLARARSRPVMLL